MSDIIKRNWMVIAITLITLAVNGGLIAMSFVMGGKVEKEEVALENKRQEVEAMKRYQYKMTEDNKKLALKNADTAWEFYNKAFDQIVEKYDVAKHDETMARTPAELVRFVREACKDMGRRLKGSKNIKLGPGVDNFTFEGIRNSTTLPPLDDVPFIVKNVVIVDAIVEVLASAGVSEVLELKRNELRVKDSGDIYKYLTFTLSVKGNFPSIRKCVNDLHNAKFLFIVRKVDLDADDLVNTLSTDGVRVDPTGRGDFERPATTPGSAAAGPGAKTKDARIAFKQMASIKANIEFDYVELIRKSATGN